jgi:hypothetical protein
VKKSDADLLGLEIPLCGERRRALSAAGATMIACQVLVRGGLVGKRRLFVKFQVA